MLPWRHLPPLAPYWASDFPLDDACCFTLYILVYSHIDLLQPIRNNPPFFAVSYFLKHHAMIVPVGHRFHDRPNKPADRRNEHTKGSNLPGGLVSKLQRNAAQLSRDGVT
jgi:hypothetical protein